MSQVTVAIFANSIKHGGHCLAGKDVNTKQWLRVVSNSAGDALNHSQVQYTNPFGTFSTKPLQKISMQLQGPAPLIQQPENYVRGEQPWRQNYSIDETELIQYIDQPNDLWGVSSSINHSSIVNGDIKISQSLYLIKVQDLNLYVNRYEKRRASFTYNNVAYDLPVTSPKFDNILETKQVLNDILCISLGEELEGVCYKIVAEIY
ncbi:hypothetical protein AB4619_16150 [Vibrio splendidus]